MRALLGRCGPRPALSIGRSLVVTVFIEIFSGTGHLGAAVARAGWATLLWDVSLGPEYDL